MGFAKFGEARRRKGVTSTGVPSLVSLPFLPWFPYLSLPFLTLKGILTYGGPSHQFTINQLGASNAAKRNVSNNTLNLANMVSITNSSTSYTLPPDAIDIGPS